VRTENRSSDDSIIDGHQDQAAGWIVSSFDSSAYLVPPCGRQASTVPLRRLPRCLRKTPLYSQLFLRLYRACLGKMIVFTYKRLKKRHFSHQVKRLAFLQENEVTPRPRRAALLIMHTGRNQISLALPLCTLCCGTSPPLQLSCMTSRGDRDKRKKTSLVVLPEVKLQRVLCGEYSV
jgi:hypothetical protein